ncbi:MAG: FtsX-like permease family protein [Sideroxydans sp.]|nr:FtsX-like permease family protein [Sideroxydans sp.]
MNGWRLSLAMLRRDWREGEWRVLFVSLLLAVSSIATVGLFADRVRLALQQESHALLGADLRISSTRALPQAYRMEAQRRGLQVLATANFPSMVSGAQQSMLSDILAAEPGYPLRGKITIDDGAVHVAQHIPVRGTLWADERLMLRLGLHRGDEVVLGKLHLRLVAQVVRDVDQSVGFASFAPRVMINAADLPASGLVQNGSRINYRLLVAGEQKQVNALRNWLKPKLGLGEKLEDVRDARPEIRTALERAEHFLGLAALTAVTLAGVALALASRRFILRHLDACAVMRCMGASQQQVLALFLYQFLLMGLGAVLLGGVLGYAAQALLVESIPAMRVAELPLPSWLPLLQAAASGMALLLGFAFLPLWQLKRVSPLRVIRRELGLPQMSTGLLYAVGVAVLCGLFLWQAGSLKLGLTVLGGLAGGLLVFGLLAWLLLHALSRLPLRNRHAFANLARHGRSNAMQIVALSLGGMALLLLTVVRADLLQNWREQMPPDVPNRFIVNIQPDQRAALEKFFAQHGLAQPELFPMVRGRLIAINGRTVNGDSYAEPRARQLAEREFNLSWADKVPTGNKVVSGAWWTHGAGPQLSVEQGIADTLDIHLGDTLTYDVAGSQFSARVSNLRKLEWDSMRVNFFVIATPDLLEDFPASYITSFHLPADKRANGDAVVKKFPNLLLIDTDAVIGQVRHIMDEIAQTLSAVFLFTLLAGLAVLYAVLLSTQDERKQHAAILRTLGAGSGYLRRLHLTEFAVLGALSGLFSAAGAGLLGWVLAQRVLNIPYAPGTLLWLAGLGGGLSLVMLSGWLVTRRVAQLPPLRVLQSV